MLEEIYIKNFILIDELNLQFTRGLNVLSGETGAGKSIIIDALSLIKGERIKSEYIRSGSKKALIEAVFDINENPEVKSFLEDQGLWEAGEERLILTREIQANGKSMARVNGRVVNLQTLKSFTHLLIDMHGQDDRQNILQPAIFLEAVDSHAVNIKPHLEKTKKIFEQWQLLQQQLQSLRLNENQRAQQLDFVAYQIKEIETLSPVPGEEEELEQLRKRITNAKRLLEDSYAILNNIYANEHSKSAGDLIYDAMSIAQSSSEDAFFAALIEPLENMYYLLEDIAQRLTAYINELDFEPNLLDETEERLFQLNRLHKKYGIDNRAVLSFLEKARQQKEKLENSERYSEELSQKIAALHNEFLEAALIIREKRQEAKAILEKTVYKELKDLSMPHIRFAIAINEREKPAATGMDEVEFLFSANPGEELRPLNKIASGGEISRFILALKSALADKYKVPTLIFDEIDVGLGGSALSTMAAKLAEMAAKHQILLVTHSPQIAAYADQHFFIEKEVMGENTLTKVKKLDPNERIKEIARMLDGEKYSELAWQHAQELLAKGFKHR